MHKQSQNWSGVQCPLNFAFNSTVVLNNHTYSLMQKDLNVHLENVCTLLYLIFHFDFMRKFSIDCKFVHFSLTRDTLHISMHCYYVLRRLVFRNTSFLSIFFRTSIDKHDKRGPKIRTQEEHSETNGFWPLQGIPSHSPELFITT